MEDLDKLTRVITNPNHTCTLKLHVKLIQRDNLGKKEFLNKVYSVNGSNYLKLDYQTFLTLECKSKDSEWSKDKSLLITDKNIHQVKKTFEIMLRALYAGKMFAIRKNRQGGVAEIVTYTDEIKKSTMVVNMLGTHQNMMVLPAVVYDERTNVSYEGVRIYINKKINVIELTIDEFEALYYNLKEVNFFTYGQMMLMSLASNKQSLVVEEARPVKQYTHQSSVFDSNITNEIKSTLVKEKDDGFMGLKGDV